jgi:signal peptidase I
LSNLIDRLHPTRWPAPLQEAWAIAKTVAFAAVIVLIPRIVLAQPFTIPSASMEPTVQEGDYIVVSKMAYGWSNYSVSAGTLPFSLPPGVGRFMAKPPHRGDVVVFSLPRDDHEVYIKRLVGVPGDAIQVRDGVLYVNGLAARQSPAAPAPTTCPDDVYGKSLAPRYTETLPGGRTHPIAACADHRGPANNTAVFRVPAGCYFMLGDNRDNSLDSRFAPLGGRQTAQAEGACPFDSSLAAALGDDWNGVGFVPADHLVGKADLILFSWSHGAALLKPWTWVMNLQLDRWMKPIT